MEHAILNFDITLNFIGGYLKPLTISDAHEKYVSGLNDSAINQYLEVRHTYQTHETVSVFIKNNIESKNSILFGIWQEGSSSHCGTIRLHGIEHFHHTAHIGICIFDKTVWGQGLGSKAIQAFSKWAIEYFNLRWIEAGAYLQNVASQKAFEAAGYNWVYDIPNKYLFEGNPTTVKVYVFEEQNSTDFVF